MDGVSFVTASGGWRDDPGRTFVIREDGSLWGWGCNSDNAIGIGLGCVVTEPVHIKDGVAFVDAASFSSVTFAIMKDGSLWGWGNCVEGQRGTRRHIMDGVVSFAAGGTGNSPASPLVMKQDGSVWTGVWSFDHTWPPSGDLLPPVQVIFPD